MEAYLTEQMQNSFENLIRVVLEFTTFREDDHRRFTIVFRGKAYFSGPSPEEDTVIMTQKMALQDVAEASTTITQQADLGTRVVLSGIEFVDPTPRAPTGAPQPRLTFPPTPKPTGRLSPMDVSAAAGSLLSASWVTGFAVALIAGMAA